MINLRKITQEVVSEYFNELQTRAEKAEAECKRLEKTTTTSSQWKNADLGVYGPEYQGQPEPVSWQYRWTNPGDQPNQPASMLEWEPIETALGQTLADKAAELRAYEYKGRKCYEVRALYAAPQAQRQPLTDEQIKQVLLDAGVRCYDSSLWPAFTAAGRAIEAAHGIGG